MDQHVKKGSPRILYRRSYLERGKRYHSIFITVMLQMDPYLIRCLNNQFRFFMSILSDGSIFRWIGKRLISQVQLLESGFLQNLKTTYTCVNIVNVHCVVCTMYTVHCTMYIVSTCIKTSFKKTNTFFLSTNVPVAKCVSIVHL